MSISGIRRTSPAIRGTAISAPRLAGRVHNTALENSSPFANEIPSWQPSDITKNSADIAKGKIAFTLPRNATTQYPESAFEKSFRNIPFLGTDVQTQRNNSDNPLYFTKKSLADDWSIKAIHGSQTAPSVSVSRKNTPPASESARQDFLNRMRQMMRTIQSHQ